MTSAFRVIVVGGGIAGLTLARALQLASIDYILLEKQSALDPQVGASIGLLPNASRILDQLGCFDDIRLETVAIETQTNHRADGSIIGQVTDTLVLLARRTGYDIVFLDRQLVLRVLAKYVTPANIRLGSQVVRVDQGQDSVVAHLADGTAVTGDIIVGADGIHSKVRSELWRHAAELGLSKQFEIDRQAMFAEYKCIFGISNNVPNMAIGETHKTFTKDLSTMTYVGKGGRVFWFIFVRMDRVYRRNEIPRFTKTDAKDLMVSCGDIAITEKGLVTVRHLYDTCESYVLVPIEEAAFKHWTLGRLICIGDAVHKVTPNLGAGGSCAIETAACLANTIRDLARGPESASRPEVIRQLNRFHQNRHGRVDRIMLVANYLTRLQALRTRREYIKTHILGPMMEDQLCETFSDFLIGAPAVEYLPFPARSLQGTMPFNPQQGWGFEETRRSRAARAIPLLLLPLALVATILYRSPAESISWSVLWNSLRRAGHDDGKAIRAQHAAIDFSALYTIWMLESYRVCFKLTLIQIPILFAVLAQLIGFGVITPGYFFVLYLESQLSKFKALDNRMTDHSHSATILALVVTFWILPVMAQSTSILEPYHARWMQMVWTYNAIIISLLQFVIVKYFIPSTMRYDRIWRVGRDMSSLRITAAATCLMSCVSWIYRHWTHSGTLSSLSWGVVEFNHNVALISALAYLLLTMSDLKRAGMTTVSWWSTVLGMIASCLCVGPAATFVTGWMWREEVLASCRHKDAVLKDRTETGMSEPSTGTKQT